MENIKQFLCGEWDLEFTLPNEDKKINTKIEVPSNVEPKLVQLGLVEDYMPADFEFATRAYELVDDWTYTLNFDAEKAVPDCTQELVFEGIDTIAQVYLNGEQIFDCCNMHMTYRKDVTDKLKDKGNELKVVIRSAELWARKHPHDMFAVSNVEPSYYDSSTYLRKARHQWGWDNAPRLITSGIIRPVYIENVPVVRFDDVYCYTQRVNDESVMIGANWIYATDELFLDGYKIRLALSDAGKVVFEETKDVFHVQGSMSVEIPREKIELWWPSGFGNPKLYDFSLQMLDKDGKLKAHYCQKFGIRKLRLDYTPNLTQDEGGEYVFRVNGEKVFARGTNWKPLDPLASLADKKLKTQKALQELINLNCNMVRIWGGGIYEDNFFFDFCDRNGIMVWQDFMFACEAVATDEWFCRIVAEEAKQIIRKYRNHTSLAVWCGDNENDEFLSWQMFDSEILPSDSVVSRKILKDAVKHFDPYRVYVDSSPIASDENFTERRLGKITHFQTENHFYPNTVYFKEELRKLKSIFIGETGPIRVNSVIADEQMFEREKERVQRLWNSPLINLNASHQSDAYFATWRYTAKNVCLARYGRDFTFEQWKDFTIAINLACAEIFKDVIEYCRASRWSKSGVLWWSLTDMWPMLFNYSVLDCNLKKKLGYFWVRQSQQEFILAGVRKEMDGELSLYAVNDNLVPHTVEYTVTAYDKNCNSKQIASGIWRQEKNSSDLIQRIAENEEAQLWIIKWTENGKEYSNHVFTKDADFETMRAWTEIIGKECGFYDELLELK